MRAFIAIPLPDETIAALERLQDDLRDGTPVAPENFHVTLCFLDDQAEHILQALHDALTEIDLPAFQLDIAGADVFGGSKPRMLWAGVTPSDPLSRLRTHVRTAATSAGIDLRREKFKPHITLARFRRDLRPETSERLARFLTHHARFTAPTVTVTSFTLYRSTLTETGPIYDSLADYSLS